MSKKVMTVLKKTGVVVLIILIIGVLNLLGALKAQNLVFLKLIFGVSGAEAYWISYALEWVTWILLGSLFWFAYFKKR